MSRTHTAKRNLTTKILMTSSAFSVTSTDKDTGEVVHIPLDNTGERHLEQVAKTLCELHGIGSRKQWGKYHHEKRVEAGERKAKWKARRKARVTAEAQRQAAQTDNGESFGAIVTNVTENTKPKKKTVAVVEGVMTAIATAIVERTTVHLPMATA